MVSEVVLNSHKMEQLNFRLVPLLSITRVSYRIFVRGGERRLVGDFGVVSHINREFRADKFQLSKCNARIHTGFCVGEREGEMCGRRT